jgi:ferredoxin
VAKQVAAILGTEAEDVVEMVAFVNCNGHCEAAKKRHRYEGIQSCAAAEMLYAGDDVCLFSCHGYGDCAAVCPEDAICLADGIARVDVTKCIGCGLCAKQCPVNAITRLDPADYPDRKLAPFTIDASKCIKCGACVASCRKQAIIKK